ncbi:MAG: hypothetical protein AB7O31_12010 [Burkholderiales bacterium]
MPSRRHLLIFVGLALALVAAWMGPLDQAATKHVEAGLKRALVSFASARALNAVISVVQGTEVSVQLAGFGPTFTPGQALDPINDLVEQFSTLMLFASVSFGVQLLLIKFGAYWAVSLALTLAALLWAWSTWRGPQERLWPTRLLVGLLLVRFAVPLVAVTSESGFQLLLADRYKADQERIELSASRVASLSTPAVPPQPGEGLAERFKRWLSTGTDAVKELSGRVDDLKKLATDMVEHIVMLIAVFSVQTLVLPLALLWAMLAAARALVRVE